MKKILLTLVTILSFASAEAFYLGAGLSQGSNEQTTSITGSTALNYDISGVDFKFGFVFASQNRIELSRNLMKSERSGSTIDLEGTDFNWVWTVTNDSMFLPFFTLGFGSYSATFPSGASASGASINGGIGVYFLLEDNIEVELTHKAQNIGYEISNITFTESMKRNYLGIKYKF